MLNTFKRGFTMAVAAVTITWSVAASFAIAPVASAAVASGDLVKGSLPAVYYVGSDMKRYVFTNDKAYKTWYADFSTVKTISDTELASITIGGNVTYKPGVRMVKIQSDPKVYAVAHGGVLRWVSTEAAAVALYGSDWNKKIDDISDAFFTNYTVGSQISSASDYVIANEQTNSPTINADKGLAGGGALNITLASDNAAGATVTRNAQGINLLKVNIAGAGTITGLTFTRLGAGVAADWSNIYLYDGDTRLTTGRSVSSTTNQVSFTNLNVAVSGTKALTLVGDLNATSTVGNASYFSLAAATDVVASATVGGSFPVAGNTFSISGTTGGSITITAGSTPSNPKLGQTAVELANFKLQAGSTEDVSVRRLVMTNSGAAQLTNLANLAIVTGGVTVAQNPIVSGSTATFVFAVPYVLGKGITRTFSVIGDIASGNRAGVDTVKLYVDQTYDLYATGNTYGAGVGVTDTFTSGYATTLTIQGGQVTFAFNGPTTGDISVGSNDAVLAKFAITSVNHVEVRNLRLQIVASSDLRVSDMEDSVTDCKVKNTDTGSTVTNQADLGTGWTTSDGLTYTKTFTDRFEITAGKTMNLALTCDVLSTAPAALAGKTLTATILARQASDVRNLDSNLDVDLGDIVPSSALTGNAQAVRVSGLTVAMATSPSSATVTKGSTVNAAGFNFTAGSASDVKITQIKLRGLIDTDGNDTYANAATAPETHAVQDVIQSATIWDGSTQLGVAASPDSSGDLNFSNLSWTVPAGTTKTVTVKVVLSNNLPYAGTSDNFIIDMIGDGTANNTTANVTAQDKDSNSVNATAASTGWSATDFHLQAGSTVTAATTIATTTGIITTVIGSGTLQLQIDGDTPVAAIVSGNTTDNSVTRIKFTSVNEAFNVTRLTVQNLNTDSSSVLVTSVRLFDKNGTLFCSGALDSNNRLRCANDAGLFTVANDNVVTVKLNLDNVGSGKSGRAPVMSVYADYDDTSFTDDIKVVGVSSGTALQDANAKVIGDTGYAAASLKIVATDMDTLSNAYVADSYAAGNMVFVSGNKAVIRKTQPTVAKIATSTTLTTVPTFYKFSVTAASNADVTLKRFNLDISSVLGSGTVGNFRVYENDTLLDASLYEVCLGASFAAGVMTCGTDVEGGTVSYTVTDAGAVITVRFASERSVSAGTTKTYRIDGAVSSVGAGDSVTMKLKDDSGQTIQTVALTSANLNAAQFVWSDTSADAHSAGTDATGTNSTTDWTNGLYVKTLPSDPQTLSL